MSDFFLDFRTPTVREQSAAQAAIALKFCEDTRVQTIQRADFSLVLASVNDADLWDPYQSGSPRDGVFVALAGRVALDEAQWQAASDLPGAGGLACKAICALYHQHGLAAMEMINGNFVVIIHDAVRNTVHLVTDRFGMGLAYSLNPLRPLPVFASHPDVLASATGENGNRDTTSLAEFLMTGKLSFPHTYYENIRALETGAVHSFTLQSTEVRAEPVRPYFHFNFQIDSRATESDLADQLADAFKKAVQRRTQPRFGLVGIGLSGGLDSRAILSAVAAPRNRVRAFTLFDEENAEYEIAKAVAAGCGVALTPIKRDPEHYGKWAELGVRISGGTGCIRSNHYLGVRQQLRDLGVQNLLTGCYCDYLFKALALNTRESKFLRIQQLDRFSFEHYLPNFWPDTPVRSRVQERLEALFPEAGLGEIGEREWLNIERKRAFPLAYEGDLAMRTIPQRVIPWFLPIADNDLMKVYLQIPSRLKLNSALFRRMMAKICGPDLCRIKDNNTGASANAGTLTRTMHRYRVAALNRFEQSAPRGLSNRGSWPTWEYYFHHSALVADSWRRPNKLAAAMFAEILSADPLQRSIQSFRGKEIPFFGRLWTQKLWLDQQCAVN